MIPHQEKNLLTELKQKAGQNVGGVTMMHGVRGGPIKGLICCDVVDVTQPLGSMKPQLVWSTTPVQDSVNMHLQPSDALRLHWILMLMLMMRLRKLIADHVILMQFHHGSILLGFGVVTPQDTWNAFRSQEVTTDITKTSLFLHATDVEHV